MKYNLFHHPSGDRPLQALALLLTGVFVIALQDSLMKLMSDQTSFWQIQTECLQQKEIQKNTMTKKQ